jgi:NADPH:quinone reductase-like Zn-dependent oxidoreductase
MNALVLNTKHRTAVVTTIPKPAPGPTDILVRVHAVALNPVDALYTFHPLGSTGRVVGSDFAGTIVAFGSAVPSSSDLDIGTRVAGFLQGACSANTRPGAFAEYAVCAWDLVWRVPEEMRFEEAASVSLCGLTAAQALFPRLGLPPPFSWSSTTAVGNETKSGKEITCFIYGASTSVALYAAQLLRRSAEMSGRRVKLFGTASRSRFAMLRAEPYGYDVLADYHDADWAEQISAAAGGSGVHYAYDCISESETVASISHLLGEGGRMAIVRSLKAGAWSAEGLAEGVDPIYGAVWEGLGEEVQYQGFTVQKSEEARRFAVAFYKWLSDGGRLVPNPLRLMPGGLERVVKDGFALLGSGKVGERNVIGGEEWMRPVSAEKLVYLAI